MWFAIQVDDQQLLVDLIILACNNRTDPDCRYRGLGLLLCILSVMEPAAQIPASQALKLVCWAWEKLKCKVLVRLLLRVPALEALMKAQFMELLQWAASIDAYMYTRVYELQLPASEQLSVLDWVKSLSSLSPGRQTRRTQKDIVSEHLSLKATTGPQLMPALIWVANEGCADIMEDLCKLPAAQELLPSQLLELLGRAMQRSTAGVEMISCLCQLPGASQLPVYQIMPLILQAVRDQQPIVFWALSQQAVYAGLLHNCRAARMWLYAA